MKKKSTDHERHNSNCQEGVDLETINDIDISKHRRSIVLVETSDRGWFYARWNTKIRYLQYLFCSENLKINSVLNVWKLILF